MLEKDLSQPTGESSERPHKDLREILADLISNGFSDLSGISISVRWSNLTDRFGQVTPRRIGTRAHGNHKRWRYVINVSTHLKAAPPNVLKGAIAHELGHIRDKRKRFAGPDRQKLLRSFLSSEPTDVEYAAGEREADLQAILAGFGSELMACYDFIGELDDSEADQSSGLCREEIESVRDLLFEGYSPKEVSSLVEKA